MPVERPLAPDALAARLAGLYQVVGPLYRKVLRIVEQDQPAMGMSVGVRAVLEHLRREGPLTVPQMARAQDLSRQFVQRSVDDALAQGWVRTQENPAHRRSRLLDLTPDGAAAVGAVLAREHRLMSQVGGGLTASDLDAAHRVLTAMLEGLEGVERERRE